MSDPDRGKPAMVIGGAFLVLAFGLWLFVLRDFTETAEGNRAQFEGQEKERVQLFSGTRELAKVLYEVNKDNAALEKTNAELLDRMTYVFVRSTIPAGDERRYPKTYLVDQYQKECVDFLNRFVTRQVECSKSARELGYTPPDAYAELDVPKVEELLRQFEAMRRVQDLLEYAFTVSDPRLPGGERALLAIHKLSGVPGFRTGAGGDEFFREYPVQVEVTITLSGLLKLLERAGSFEPVKPEGEPDAPAVVPFHALRNLAIEPVVVAGPRSASKTGATPNAPPVRDAVRHDQPVRDEAAPPSAAKPTKERREQWFTHYYKVQMTLSTIESLEEKEIKKAPDAEKPKGPRRIISRM